MYLPIVARKTGAEESLTYLGASARQSFASSKAASGRPSLRADAARFE